MFGTTIDTADNMHAIVGNATLGAADQQAANPHPAGRYGQNSNVCTSPAPDVSILQFTVAGPVLVVRPYCHNDAYWRVYFDTNKLIRESLTGPSPSVPSDVLMVRSQSAGA
jgi:small conductance mechanosensitive channel